MIKNKWLKLLGFAALFAFFLCGFFSLKSQDRPNKQNQDLECWEQYLMKPLSNKNSSKMDYIPSTIEEAPVGKAPAIPVDFLIEEKDYCSKRPSLWVIVYVHTAIKNTKRRAATRKTWAVSSKLIGIVFMVGRAKNLEEEEIVKRESELYHDIVQGNYTDLYRLLDYKALNSLHWLTTNCEKVPWVVHADDDVIVDVFQLLGAVLLLNKEGRYNEIFCNPFVGSHTWRRGKWSVLYEEYPCETYPPYCSGPAWFTSMEVIKVMLKTVPLVKYLWVDDVFVTGILVAKGGIKITGIPVGMRRLNLNEIGNVILWLNLKSNRTADWIHVIDYYEKKNFNEIFTHK